MMRNGTIVASASPSDQRQPFQITMIARMASTAIAPKTEMP